MSSIAETIHLLRCALADLQGSMQAKNNCDIHSHDWEAHQTTIDEIEEFLNDI
jgi:hypothetical protein